MGLRLKVHGSYSSGLSCPVQSQDGGDCGGEKGAALQMRGEAKLVEFPGVFSL